MRQGMTLPVCQLGVGVLQKKPPFAQNTRATERGGRSAPRSPPSFLQRDHRRLRPETQRRPYLMQASQPDALRPCTRMSSAPVSRRPVWRAYKRTPFDSALLA